MNATTLIAVVTTLMVGGAVAMAAGITPQELKALPWWEILLVAAPVVGVTAVRMRRSQKEP